MTYWKQCQQCGECCKAEVCRVGKYCYKTDALPCPGLLFEGGRHWCELIKNIVTDPDCFALEFHMGIGLGCDSY